jgi:hypothetical protein
MTIRPGIARIWRGRTTRDRADEYEKYNYEVGINRSSRKPWACKRFVRTPTRTRSS